MEYAEDPNEIVLPPKPSKKKFLIGLLFIGVSVSISVSLLLVRNYSQSTRSSAKVTGTQQVAITPSPTPLAAIATIVTGLDTPWSLVFLPDGEMLVTERPGRVRRIAKNNHLDAKPVATINVSEIGEGGLLGITIDPEFSTNRFVYLYYTYSTKNDATLNKVVRMIYENKSLVNETSILENIPGASNHNGGRIKFGPDNYLYVTTGDASEPSQAQNTSSLAGKILRITKEGKPAPGNPFSNEVFSYGHRNPQGITWDSQGRLWETEHGRSGIQSGLDELNLIEIGKNYGWPNSQGNTVKNGTIGPIEHSGSFTTWAPGGVVFLNNSLFFTGLRGKTLYEAPIEKGKITEIKKHLENEYGRIRDVIVGPDSMLYITTSNNDGRGTPQNEDDKVVRINPATF